MITFLRCHTRTLILGVLLCLLIATRCSVPINANAAELLPPCNSTPATPPLLVVLPDGTEVPATMIVYDLAALRLEVIGYPGVFCDGFEGAAHVE